MKLKVLPVQSAMVVSICALAGVLAAAQAPARAPQPDMRQTGTAAISGVVVDGETGRSLAGVVVHLGRTPRGPVGRQNRQVSDSRGRFVFVDLPAGEGFSLSGSKPGYQQPPGTSTVGSISLAEGQWIDDARVVMRRAGAIEGVVTDERGDPVAGVEVRTIARISIAGRDQVAAGPSTTTDDRGRYRLGNLLPGRYLVAVPSQQVSASAFATMASVNGMDEARFAALPTRHALSIAVPILDADDGMRIVLGRQPVPPPASSDGQRFGYPLTFHPGTPDLDQAAVIPVGAGAFGASADIQLRPAPTGYLRGRVEGPGQIANLIVRLVSKTELGLGFETATARTHVDGTFAFANVPAGDYFIDVPVALTEYHYRPSLGPGDLPTRPPGLGSFSSRSNSVRGAQPGTSVTSYSSGSVSFAGGAVSATTDNSEGLWAREPVSIRPGASPDLVVRLRGTARIGGRVVVEGDISDLQPNTLSVNLAADPADGSAALGMPTAFPDRNDPARPFVISGVGPGRYFLRQAFPNQWVIRSVEHSGRNYFEQPIDLTDGQSLDGVIVTITRASATIVVSLAGPAGVASADLHAVVFPADRSAWTSFGLQSPRLASMPASATGPVRFTNLPAGEYHVAVVGEDDLGSWRTEDAMARLAATAERVTVDWAQTANVSVRMSR